MRIGIFPIFTVAATDQAHSANRARLKWPAARLLLPNWERWSMRLRRSRKRSRFGNVRIGGKRTGDFKEDKGQAALGEA